MTTGNTTSGPSTTQTQAEVPTGSTGKDLAKRYGIHKRPIVVGPKAMAFAKVMNFDEQFQSGPNKQITRSWIVIDPEITLPAKELPDSTLEAPKVRPAIKGGVVRGNTYNGGLGAKVDYFKPASCGPIPPMTNADGSPSKVWKDMIKGYQPIPVGEVPFVVQVIPEPVIEEPVIPVIEEPVIAPEATEAPASEEAPA